MNRWYMFDKFMWSGKFGGALLVLFAGWLLATPVLAGQPAYGARQGSGDIEFQYDLMPSAIIAAHEHGEPKMHGGARGQNDTHVLVALFERSTGARISDAIVHVTIGVRGGEAVSKKLELMMIDGLASYGGYVPVPQPGLYRIRFEARRPGVAVVAYAEFERRVTREGASR